MWETIGVIAGLIGSSALGIYLAIKVRKFLRWDDQNLRKKAIKQELRQQFLDAQYEKQAAQEMLASYQKNGRV